VKRVVLVTEHHLESKRKAGFHWLADAYWRAGWEVIFLTVGISWLSWLRRDYRLAYIKGSRSNRIIWLQERLGIYVWLTLWHPADLRLSLLNRISYALFAKYGELPLGEIEEFIARADLLVFESTSGLLLFDRFRQINNHARFVYRVSDDLKLLRVHPVVREVEARCAPKFDLISCPSYYIYRHFAKFSHAEIHPHGVRKELFDQCCLNPYPPGSYNLIFVGNSHLDGDFLAIASSFFPNWTFHVIGSLPNVPKRSNIFPYGELSFEDTIPYVKYANIGLQTRSYTPGAESLTDSLKVMQYTYCGLPIVAPEFLRSPKPHVFYYIPGNCESIRQALIKAQAFDRTRVPRDTVPSWDDVAEAIAGGSLTSER
jgi:2-beta-glucuronyltransferase